MAEELFSFSIMAKTPSHLSTPNANYRFTRKHIENIKSLRIESPVTAEEVKQLAMLKRIQTLELLGGFSDQDSFELFDNTIFEKLTDLYIFPWDYKSTSGLNHQKNLQQLSLGLVSDLIDLDLENLEALMLDLPEHSLSVDLTKLINLTFLSLAVGRNVHNILLPENLKNLNFQSFSHNECLSNSSQMDLELKGVTFDAKGIDISRCKHHVDVHTNRVVLTNFPTNNPNTDSILKLADPYQNDFAQIPSTTTNLSVFFWTAIQCVFRLVGMVKSANCKT